MQNSKQIWAWVGGVVVVLAVIAYFVWPSQKSTAPTGSTGPVPVYAPTGQTVASFPKQLILDDAAQVNSSYSIGYSSSTNQYTAVFNSSSSMASFYASYKTYLTGNGWMITNDITKYPQSRGLYAENSSTIVSVAIVAQGSGSQVTVTYVTK